MKCDKCGSELDGVFVGPGDVVITMSGERVTVYGMFTDMFAVGVAGCSRGWTFVIRDCRTLDGRPVLGFRDPRDERIKELEKELAEARGHPNITKALNALHREGWVKLDDQAIQKIHTRAGELWAKDLSWQFTYGQALRDFRDGRL